MRPSLAAAALGMLSLAQLSSAFLHTAPRHAARAALLKTTRSSSQPQQPLGRAGLSRMMATVAPSSAASVKKLSSPQDQLLNDVGDMCVCVGGCRGVSAGRGRYAWIDPGNGWMERSSKACDHPINHPPPISSFPPQPHSIRPHTHTQVDVFIFDCDGVIWRGDSLIEKVPAVLEKLRAAGKRMFFVTNNSTKSRKGYKSKFTSLGLNVRTPRLRTHACVCVCEAATAAAAPPSPPHHLPTQQVQDEEIFSSSFAAAAYLEQKDFKASGKKVYVIGEAGIEEELDLIGVPHIGGPSDKGKTIDLKPGYALEIDHDVGAVVVGFDRHFNYHKIQYAQLCINENNVRARGGVRVCVCMTPVCLLFLFLLNSIPLNTHPHPTQTLQAEFIATNMDAVTHLTDAQEWAGAGSMVGAIKGCTGQEPTLVGKPSPLMIDYIVFKYQIPKGKICMVGDRLDTDILFGKDNGLKTCLTLSGVTSEEKLLGPANKIHPDYYVASIADFYAEL